jgi:predicted metal-dependent peptidase
MNISEKVKIGGQFYTIKFVDKCNTDNRNTDGQIIYGENTIEIRKDLQGDYLDYVLIHEIFHGIYEHCGFKQNENEVDRLSRALHMVIKDNPDIFK